MVVASRPPGMPTSSPRWRASPSWVGGSRWSTASRSATGWRSDHAVPAPGARSMTGVDALVLEEPRRLVRREFARPTIGEDDALLRVEACGLCGTDHEEYVGLLGPGRAFVPGHETVGVVDEIGSAAAERWGVRSGDRVAVEVFRACGACEPCRTGRYRFCERNGIATMYGFVPADDGPGLWGGYGRYQYLAPDSQLLTVPEAL